MIGKQMMTVAVLAMLGLGWIAEQAQAQVRVVVGVGGRRPSAGPAVYFGVGPSYYPRYYPSYYPSYYYAQPSAYYYPAPMYVQPAPTYVPTAPAYVVPASAQTADHAYVRVLVPDANAKVWINGNLTKQSGLNRLFHTPKLDPGSSYSYRVRAAWIQNGVEVIQEFEVSVRPGQTSVVDFRKPVSEPLP